MKDRILELVSAYQGGKHEAISEIWKESYRYIVAIARHYSGVCELDDLIQESYFGLVRAVETFEPEHGSFFPYLGGIVGRTLSRYINETQSRGPRLPEQKKVLLWKVNKLEAEKAITGEHCTDKDICSLLDITESTLADLRKSKVLESACCLDAPIDMDGNTLADTIPDNKDDMESATRKHDHNTMSVHLWGIIKEAGTFDIMRLLYVDNLSIRQVATITGKTESQITTAKWHTLRTLRSGNNRKVLKPYYDSYLNTSYYHGTFTSFNNTWTSEPEKIALDNIERLESVGKKKFTHLKCRN